MKALLCGRGTSLSYYKKLNETYDYIYLINEFNRFIVEDPNLLNFFKIDFDFFFSSLMFCFLFWNL